MIEIGGTAKKRTAKMGMFKFKGKILKDIAKI